MRALTVGLGLSAAVGLWDVSSAVAAGRSASFTATGALHVTVRGAVLCNAFTSDGTLTVSFSGGGATVTVYEYKTGRVNIAKTPDAFVTISRFSAGKTALWVAGWSGETTPGPPSSIGEHFGSGTLDSGSIANVATGSLDLNLPPASADLAPVNSAKGTVHLSAHWSCGPVTHGG